MMENLYMCRDVISYITSYLSITDKFHFIICCTTLYTTHKHILDPTSYGNKPLLNSITKGYIQAVQSLLKDPRVDPTVDGNEPLLEAIRRGNTSIAQMLLLDPRVDPTSGDNRVLSVAVYYGNVDIVRALLLDPRVDPTIYDNNILILSCLYYMNTLEDNDRLMIKILAEDYRVMRSTNYDKIKDKFLVYLLEE